MRECKDRQLWVEIVVATQQAGHRQEVISDCSFANVTTHAQFRLMKNMSDNGVHLSHSRQVAHVYYQLFDSKMADGDQLWSVPKLEYDLLRRNASTNGRKTDLIERYILHRKPKHTIYVRYFSIFCIC